MPIVFPVEVLGYYVIYVAGANAQPAINSMPSLWMIIFQLFAFPLLPLKSHFIPLLPSEDI